MKYIGNSTCSLDAINFAAYTSVYIKSSYQLLGNCADLIFLGFFLASLKFS